MEPKIGELNAFYMFFKSQLPHSYPLSFHACLDRMMKLILSSDPSRLVIWKTSSSFRILHLSHFILHLANGIDMVSLVYLHIHVVLAKQIRAV